MEIKRHHPELKERGRERFSPLVTRYLEKLYNFARREIAYYVAEGDLLPGEIAAEDLVDAALLRAYREVATKQDGRESKHWLIGLVAEQLEAEVKRLKAARARSVHIEEDIPETPPAEEVTRLGEEILYFYQPDEDQKLEDLIPDMKAPTPEQIPEIRELQHYLVHTLAALPRIWRRAFVLHYVEGLPVAEIARMIKHPEAEVERQLEDARQDLRQRLIEAGFDDRRDVQAVLTIFGGGADVEVPAVFRSAVIEKFKKLEEADDR
ncbi:MAG TPA: sigma-70 family RNA polymerase sigma factor [Blastocatellia bacterium]|nr:sigma-70 family RNA polymerase sigma factor [Blastocatellia bacterium]